MIETLKQRFLRMHRTDVKVIHKASNGVPDCYRVYCTCGSWDNTHLHSEAYRWSDRHLIAAAGGRWSW